MSNLQTRTYEEIVSENGEINVDSPQDMMAVAMTVAFTGQFRQLVRSGHISDQMAVIGCERAIDVAYAMLDGMKYNPEFDVLTPED